MLPEDAPAGSIRANLILVAIVVRARKRPGIRRGEGWT
jgi:hypothetical protein